MGHGPIGVDEVEERDAVACSRDHCVTFLDFTNAYGSILQQALLDALRGAGAGNRFVDLITDLYTDNRTTIVAADSMTAPTPILAGISSVIFHSSWRVIDCEWPEFYQNRSVKVPGTGLLRVWIISVQIYLFFVDFPPTPGWPGPPGL
ncbi:hypothetical protein HPB49_005437 [Dermacentor silvarum]|uniref:Uncharacterized protein n=1 Tax=Dermacentor silvarum TaxID=543639 RepID=A0ACB8D328_DERSI|nr:hypothetical protein HPB49_005437 [Dermacentor silvarum]